MTFDLTCRHLWVVPMVSQNHFHKKISIVYCYKLKNTFWTLSILMYSLNSLCYAMNKTELLLSRIWYKQWNCQCQNRANEKHFLFITDLRNLLLPQLKTLSIMIVDSILHARINIIYETFLLHYSLLNSWRSL